MSSFGRIFLVIKIWDVIVGITPVAFGSKICNAQMIEARKENQDPNNQDRDSSVCFSRADVSCEEEGSNDNENGANQEQHSSQRNSLVRDFWRALLELQVNVAFVSTGEFGIFHFAIRD